MISQIFDRMLSLEFIDKSDIEKIYYKLLKYTKNININLAKDYEVYFLEKYEEEKDKNYIKLS